MRNVDKLINVLRMLLTDSWSRQKRKERKRKGKEEQRWARLVRFNPTPPNLPHHNPVLLPDLEFLDSLEDVVLYISRANMRWRIA